ncbi:MAG: hypothetical protein IKE21_07640 [Erysipelotrichaceae bacterium]|nr:hypothetical protein [Erysipelotrichaceae bacterium]
MNELQEAYCSLLLRREVLRKEAVQYQISYMQIFGELLTEAYQEKLHCIALRKQIAFCQKRINQGQQIDAAELDQYLALTMEEYYQQLDVLLAQSRAAAEAKTVSSLVSRKVKKLYYALAKMIHPDLHPELADNETLQEYWEELTFAYESNDLQRLEELKVLVESCLAELHNEEQEIDIPDLPLKINAVRKEIEEILHTDPYLYRFFLADQEAVEEKKKELQQEIADSHSYAEELEGVLASFPIRRNTA